MRLRFFSCVWILIFLLEFNQAEEVDTNANKQVASVKPAIESLENGDMKLAGIVFNPKSREIRIPCQINMIDGLIECAVVHENGKVHESLLKTKESPTNLNIVLKLLRYKSSAKLYGLNSTDATLAKASAAISQKDHQASWLRMDVEWNDGSQLKRFPFQQLIINHLTQQSPDRGKWVYGGSNFEKGQFIAENTGDLACIYMAAGALILYDGKGNTDDEIWIPKPNSLPAVNTPVTWIIYPDEDATKP